MTSEVCVRIAPSPTGEPHVGTAYVALFNYAFARQHGGRFILRIEDTDQTRSNPLWETEILRSLSWLGLTWDEGPDVGGPHGPYRQSERSALYAEHAERLIAGGHAYPCFCSAERIEALRAEQRAAKATPGYDALCRKLPPQEAAAQRAAGEAHVVRLAIPRGETTTVKDRLRGEVTYDNAILDEQVLLKSDGMPTYHLANVVDDHLMGVTHVIRAEEWLSSTPKHVLLYRAFGWDLPEFVHLPLLRNQDRSKISKRKNPVSLNYYRRAGFLPQALLNYLALMGWGMPDGRELFSLEEMIAAFDLDRVSLGGPVFDVEKLTWLNGRTLRELMSQQDIIRHLREEIFSEEALGRIVPLVQERLKVLEEFVPMTSYFFGGLVEPEIASLVPKKRGVGEIRKGLAMVADRVEGQAEWGHEAIEALLRELAESTGLGVKGLFMSVRVAVTGTATSPPLFESMEVLGRDICKRRLRHAVSRLQEAERAG